MENDILKVIASREDIDSICKRLGDEITKDYQDKKPIVVGLLKGCLPFMSDLTKHINTYITLDYMAVSSYNGGTESSGKIKIKKDIESNIENKDVIIVDDIMDTGITLSEITALFKSRNARSVKTCVLLNKPLGRKVNIEADYIGMEIPKEFVVGYGLDYEGYYRNLPYIGVLKPNVYEK